MGFAIYAVNFGPILTNRDPGKTDKNKNIFGNEEEILQPKNYVIHSGSSMDFWFSVSRNILKKAIFWN